MHDIESSRQSLDNPKLVDLSDLNKTRKSLECSNNKQLQHLLSMCYIIPKCFIKNTSVIFKHICDQYAGEKMITYAVLLHYQPISGQFDQSVWLTNQAKRGGLLFPLPTSGIFRQVKQCIEKQKNFLPKGLIFDTTQSEPIFIEVWQVGKLGPPSFRLQISIIDNQ